MTTTYVTCKGNTVIHTEPGFTNVPMTCRRLQRERNDGYAVIAQRGGRTVADAYGWWPHDAIPAWALKPDALYLGDAGRTFCGEHLGATAAMTGRDLHGAELIEVTADLLRAASLPLDAVACERCDKQLGRTA